jgi:hypothetical protein
MWRSWKLGQQMAIPSFMLPPKPDQQQIRRRASTGQPMYVWSVVIVCFAVACSRRPDAVAQRLAPNGVALAPNVTCPTSDCNGYNVHPNVLYRSRYGIGCLGNVPPGTTPNPERPPQSYRIRDVGRPGFPKLTSQEVALVQRVRHYVRSDTLRIAWIDSATTQNGFIIFDASDGPCSTDGRYMVLNGSCNEFYEPGENPYETKAAPDCIPTKRPWLGPHW